MKRMKKRRDTFVTKHEFEQAEITLIKMLQRDKWPEEVQRLESKKPILNRSWIANLNVFLDENGVMRVGGRINKASLPYDQRHPIILPNGEITRCLIARPSEQQNSQPT